MTRPRFAPTLSALVAALVAGGCAAPPDRWKRPGDHRGALDHFGRRRVFFIHVPDGWTAARRWPLVIALHGGGGAGSNMGTFTGFDAVADREGFVAVYPSGIDAHWNDGRAEKDHTAIAENVDDVGFIRSLVGVVSSALSIDPDRVYVVGISNGAMMTYRLGCEATDLFAAAAGAIQSMPVTMHAEGRPSRPLPMMIIAGEDDPLVPFEGGTSHFADRPLAEVVSFADTVAFWRAVNGCVGEPEVTRLPDVAPDDGTRVRVERHGGGDAPVELWVIEGGGHAWPGGGSVFETLVSHWSGTESEDVDAPEVVWEFFSRHARR